MKKIIGLALTVTLISCNDSSSSKNIAKSENNESKIEENIPSNFKDLPIYEQPKNFTILKEVEGDLDNDKINEKVIVFETIEGDLGMEREIYILKKQEKEWYIWEIAKGPVMSSESGGMMGDPFSYMSIMDNTLVIEHSGGASEKWMYTHFYSWIDEDDGFVVSFASSTHGSVCYEWEIMEYTILGGENGEIITYTEIEDCESNSKPKIENKKTYNLPVKLVKMKDFSPGDNPVKVEEKTTFYF